MLMKNNAFAKKIKFWVNDDRRRRRRRRRRWRWTLWRHSRMTWTCPGTQVLQQVVYYGILELSHFLLVSYLWLWSSSVCFFQWRITSQKHSVKRGSNSKQKRRKKKRSLRQPPKNPKPSCWHCKMQTLSLHQPGAWTPRFFWWIDARHRGKKFS